MTQFCKDLHGGARGRGDQSDPSRAEVVANGGAAVESEPTEGVRAIELPIAGLFRGTADEFSDRAGPGR